jgi:ketosteroid isomerase-like protein
VDDDVGVVRAATDAFNREDEEAAATLFHPEGHRIIPVRAALEDTVFAGPDAWREFVVASRDAWSQIRIETQEIRACPGGRVLALGRLVATARESGADVEMDCGWVYTLRDGLITEIRTYTDPAEAVRAAE